MTYQLEQSEYHNMKLKENALKAIERIISEAPTDEHGNAMGYAYRFDKTISSIMDVLDRVKNSEIVYKTPW